MRNVAICPVVVLIAAAATAQTRNVIRQYNTALTQGVHYSIAGEDIHIIAGIANASSRFKFEARTEQWNGSQWIDIGVGDIELIDIQSGASPGTVRIEVNGDPGLSHVHGARHVREIRLPTSVTADSIIHWVRITGDLGLNGLDSFDSIGLIEVGGDALGNLYAATLTNALTIGGNLDNGLTLSDGLAGSVTIYGDINSDVSIAGTVSGTISVGEIVDGVLEGGNVNGTVQLETVSASGAFLAKGDLNDVGSNRLWVRQLNGGTIRCRDMKLRPGAEGGNMFVLGRASSGGDPALNVVQSGTVEVTGTLRGVLLARTKCGELNINVQTIDAGISGYDWIEYGGIWVFVPGPGLDIEVAGDFKRGFIRAVGDYNATYHNGLFEGSIDIAGDLGQNVVNNVAQIGADYCSPFHPPGEDDPCVKSPHEMALAADIRVHGDAYETNASYPAVVATGGLQSKILIDGSLLDRDSAPTTPADAIVIGGAMDANAAIVIDYNGWIDGDDWDPNAQIRVNGTSYTANGQAPRIYEVAECRGDMNNDGSVTSSDDAPFALTQSAYATAWPGLDGSWAYHRDANQDGTIGTGSPNSGDQAAYDWIRSSTCCIPVCNDTTSDCPGDIDVDGDVDLTDLAILLTWFGGPPPSNQPCVDLNQSGTVDLTDLAIVTGNMGTICDCSPGLMADGGEPIVDPALVEWIQQASLAELFEWYANWDGRSGQHDDR